MQPMLVLTASQPGLMSINGSFAGEIGTDTALMRPVSPRGAVYLEYRPFSDHFHAMARRLVFSGGEPMVESCEAAQGLNIVIWPGGISEIEFSPTPESVSVREFNLQGHRFYLEADGRLSCEGHTLGRIPPDTQPPEVRMLQDCAVITGRREEESWMLSCDAGLTRQTGFLSARQLEVSSDGRIRTISGGDDLVGHASLEIWQLTEAGLNMISDEPVWAHGTPRWPQSPGETARAWVEAVLAGLSSEAEGYLSPALRKQIHPELLMGAVDLCVEMKYALPDNRPCVGLLQLEGDQLARVRPLYYRAGPSGGLQGPWQLEKVEWG